MKKIVTILSIIIIAILTATTVLATTGSSNTTPQENVNETEIIENTNVYILPLINSTKLSEINANTKVTLISNAGKWTYVQNDQISGWVISSKLKSNEIKNESNLSNTIENEINEITDTNSNTNSDASASTTINFPITMYVNVDAVYIRSSANKTSEKVASVGKNTPVRVTAKEGDWYKVEVSDGKGYMLSQYLSKDKVD